VSCSSEEIASLDLISRSVSGVRNFLSRSSIDRSIQRLALCVTLISSPSRNDRRAANRILFSRDKNPEEGRRQDRNEENLLRRAAPLAAVRIIASEQVEVRFFWQEKWNVLRERERERERERDL
jgi:hypothetical protein